MNHVIDVNSLSIIVESSYEICLRGHRSGGGAELTIASRVVALHKQQYSLCVVMHSNRFNNDLAISNEDSNEKKSIAKCGRKKKQR